jgi:ribosomal protein S18 acetylase RimI-like enzyme
MEVFMRTIKSAIFAILMTCAAMPAWGMDYFNAAANLAPLLPFVASSYIPFIRGMRMAKPKRIHVPSNDPHFIPFEEKYAQDVLKVFHNTFGYAPALDTNRYQIRIWIDEGEIKGVILFTKQSPSAIYVNYLAVDKKSQRHGIGTKILNALQEELAADYPDSCCISLQSVASAISFYQKFGFTCNGYACKKTFNVA